MFLALSLYLLGVLLGMVVGTLITYMLCFKQPPAKEGEGIKWPTLEG